MCRLVWLIKDIGKKFIKIKWTTPQRGLKKKTFGRRTDKLIMITVRTDFARLALSHQNLYVSAN
jgi:hypothetical protein